MAFDVGSIEGTLDLDRKPFQESLMAARRLGSDFEGEQFTAILDADSSQAHHAIERTTGEADRLDHKRIRIPVNVDEDSRGLSGLRKVGMALAPISALAIGATGAVGGLAAIMAPAALGVAGFAALAVPAMTQVMKAAGGDKKALEQLDPALRPAVAQAKAAKQEFKGLQSAMAPEIIPVFTGAMRLGLDVLKLLTPAIHGTAGAFKGLEGDAGAALDSPFWRRFFDWVGRQAGPAITMFGHVLGNLAHGFAGILMAFTPIIRPIEGGLERMSRSFAQWGQNLGHTQSFKVFLDYLRQNGPLMVETLKNVGLAIARLGGAFALAGPSTLSMINSMAKLILGLTKGHPELTKFIMNMVVWGLTIKQLTGPMGAMVTAFSALGGAVMKMGGLVISVFRGLGVAGSFLMANPVIAAVAAVIAIAVLVATHWKETKAILSTVWNAIKDAAEAVWGAIKTALVAYITAPVKLAELLWKGLRTVLTGIWHGIRDVAKTVWNAVKNVITAPIKAVVGWLKDTWRGASKFVSDVWRGLANFASKVWRGITNTVAGIVRNLVHIVTDAWNGASRMLGTIWNGVRNIAAKAWGAIRTTVGNAIRGALNIIKSLANDFYNAGVHFIQRIIDGVVNAAKTLWNTAKNIVSRLRDMLPFSEPKDPTSPLRGLHKSGEAIVLNIARGLLGARGHLTAAMLAMLGDGANAASKFAMPAIAGPSIGASAFAARPVPIARRPGARSAQRMEQPGGGRGGVNIEKIEVTAAGGGTPDPRMAAAGISQAIRDLGGA